MKDLKFSIFDLFSYSLPGGIALIAFLFMGSEMNNLEELANKASKINIGFGIGILLVFTSYIIGNAIDSIGSWIYVKIGIKIWGNPKDNNRKISVGFQRSLVRNYSPENYIYIQKWKVVKTMSHNLSFSFLLLGIIVIIKMIMNEESRNLHIIILTLISFLFSLIFLNRAHIFDRWHYKDLTNVVDSLHLQEKAIKDSKKVDNEKKTT